MVGRTVILSAALIPPAVAIAALAVGVALGRRRALAQHHCPQIYVSPEELDIP